MVSIGTIIGDRYEILEKVGSGGMADVFRAKCHRLNRYVAIKILKQDYSEDTKFVTKFRGEAQAIAGISHPNIVGKRYVLYRYGTCRWNHIEKIY